MSPDGTFHPTNDAMPRIVLASSSPRRRELLAGLGLAFEVRPADIDEAGRAGETPVAYVDRLSVEKARAVAAGLPDDRLVIAADTVVVVEGEMLGKPRDSRQNRAYIERLSGRTHQVCTGHCLVRGDRLERIVRTTEVVFRDLDEAERERYVATGEGADKAGGYAIQGIGASLVDRIDGCYFNVVGLSLAAVVLAARRLGVALV